MMSIGRMRISTTALSITLALLVLALVFWLSRAPAGLSASERRGGAGSAGAADQAELYLGLIPERDIFAQRQRYRALADYLADALDRPVELVTSNTYHGALNDMARGRIDGAFMGSMVATLTLDQLQARVLVKPQTADGVTTYRGVIFVRDDSPIQTLDDLAGRSIAMVRTTTAGHLFPIYALARGGMLAGDDAVVMRWVGTHDQAIEEVFSGRVDAGAAKDLRIDAFESRHTGSRFRRLVSSEAVPNNALIVRRDLDDSQTEQLLRALLRMHEEEAGRQALSMFGAERFVPCGTDEYDAVHDMSGQLGEGWGRLGSPDAPPRVPSDATHTQAAVDAHPEPSPPASTESSEGP